MQIEKPDKNIYHELFKSNCLFLAQPVQSCKPDFIELMLIHVGLIHNAMGLAFLELVKGFFFKKKYIPKFKIFKVYGLFFQTEVEPENNEILDTETQINDKENYFKDKNSEEITYNSPIKDKNEKNNDKNSPKQTEKDIIIINNKKTNEKLVDPINISIVTEKSEFSSVKSQKNKPQKSSKNEEMIKKSSQIPIIIEKYQEPQKTVNANTGITRLTEKIKKNSQKTSYEQISHILNSSKKKPMRKKQDITYENNEKSFLSLNENNEKHFLGTNENNPNILAYTKNFKKKKFEEHQSDFPLKKLKPNENANIISKKQSIRSRKKFVINKTETDTFLQFSQSLKASDENLLVIKPSTKEKENIKIDFNKKEINSLSYYDNIDPFRQKFRKKEDRDKLTGFSCDQCEKVFYWAIFNLN